MYSKVFMNSNNLTLNSAYSFKSIFKKGGGGVTVKGLRSKMTVMSVKYLVLFSKISTKMK